MSFKLSFHQAASKIITFVFTGFFGIFSLIFGVNDSFPETPDDFSPVVRFVACSDLHLSDEESGVKNQEKFRKLIEKAYELSQNSSYKKLDALMVAGDFTEGGAKDEYEIFCGITDELLKEETQLLTCLGNHEFIDYRDNDASVAYDVYKQFISENVDTHEIIGGYHFIGVSYDDSGEEKFETKEQWLIDELEEAVRDTGDKPIFVYQHPHPTMTVYGSINWSNLQIKSILRKYPQVVDFSGHSHYAANDPRSVWQGSFTAIGCGGVTGAMGNLSYISGDEYGDGDSGTFWLVEADKDGNVRLRLYDIVSDCFFEDSEMYLTKLSNRRERGYTWTMKRRADTAPKFPKNAEIKVSTAEDGSTEITFPEAEGFYNAENYKIAVTKSGRNLKSLIVLSDYIRANDDEKTVNLGKIGSGDFEITVRAYSPYAKEGEELVWSGSANGAEAEADAAEKK